MKMRQALIEGVGHYLPRRVVENCEFEKSLETNDAWIRSRTGIERRHFSSENETTSNMYHMARFITSDTNGHWIIIIIIFIYKALNPNNMF